MCSSKCTRAHGLMRVCECDSVSVCVCVLLDWAWTKWNWGFWGVAVCFFCRCPFHVAFCQVLTNAFVVLPIVRLSCEFHFF